MGDVEKLCVICGEDCSGSPRTKDKQGHYYHRTCYDRAKEQQDARRADGDGAAASMAIPDREPDALDMLSELIEAPPDVGGTPVASSCPMCGQAQEPDAILCMNCGYNVRGEVPVAAKGKKPKKPKKAKKERGGGEGIDLGSYLRNPLYVSLAYLGVNVVMVLLMKSAVQIPLVALMALAWYGLFSLAWTAVGILVLVAAFREGIGTGLLTLCLPFYVLFFIYRCDNQWAQFLFVVNLLTAGLLWMVFGVGP